MKNHRRGIAPEGRATGGHLIQHRAETEQIGASIQVLASCLLRRYIRHRAQGSAGAPVTLASWKMVTGQDRSCVTPQCLLMASPPIPAEMLFVITVAYHRTHQCVWDSSRPWAAPLLLNPQAPFHERPHEIRGRLHFLLANGKKISYIMRLGRGELKDCRLGRRA